MHKQITTSASKMTFESKWKLMWIFKQGVNIAVTDVLIVDAVKAIVDAIDDVVVVVIVVVVAVKAIVVAVDVVVVAAVVVVVARKQSKLIDGSPKIKMKEFNKNKLRFELGSTQAEAVRL